MEDFDILDEELGDEILEEELFAEETRLSFDDIVSFTMMLETAITLAGISAFLILILLHFV